jgi:hypothetical protein
MLLLINSWRIYTPRMLYGIRCGNIACNQMVFLAIPGVMTFLTVEITSTKTLSVNWWNRLLRMNPLLDDQSISLITCNKIDSWRYRKKYVILWTTPGVLNIKLQKTQIPLTMTYTIKHIKYQLGILKYPSLETVYWKLWCCIHYYTVQHGIYLKNDFRTINFGIMLQLVLWPILSLFNYFKHCNQMTLDFIIILILYNNHVIIFSSRKISIVVCYTIIYSLSHI